MFVSLSTMAMLVLFASTKGAYVFAWGMLLGLALQFLFLAPMLHRYGYRHSFVAVVDHAEIRNALKSYATLSAMSVIAGAGAVVNRIMAAWLPTGSISALGYADKLIQVPLVIFSGSVVTAIYPYFSGQIAGNKTEDMKHTLDISIRMGGFIFAPITALMMTLSAPVVALLFQRGAFDATATALTSTVLIFCAFQLFPVYSLAVMQRLVFAFQDVASVAKITVASIALTIALNYIFIKTINPPAAGIALSGAVVCVISAFLYSIVLKKRMKNLHGLIILNSLLRIFLAAVAAGAATRLAFGYFSTIQYHAVAPAILQTFVIALSAFSGMAVYAAAALIFKFEEALKIIAAVKSKMSRNKAGI
jgi:putative peptidoglycan lipid II flippase